MDKELINDMLEDLYDKLEDLKDDVGNIVNEPVCKIEKIIEGGWDTKGLVDYFEDAIKLLYNIQEEINKDDAI